MSLIGMRDEPTWDRSLHVNIAAHDSLSWRPVGINKCNCVWHLIDSCCVSKQRHWFQSCALCVLTQQSSVVWICLLGLVSG